MQIPRADRVGLASGSIRNRLERASGATRACACVRCSRDLTRVTPALVAEPLPCRTPSPSGAAREPGARKRGSSFAQTPPLIRVESAVRQNNAVATLPHGCCQPAAKPPSGRGSNRFYYLTMKNIAAYFVPQAKRLYRTMTNSVLLLNHEKYK